QFDPRRVPMTETATTQPPTITEEPPETTRHPAFDVAKRVAPRPQTIDDATAERWTRHHAALALAAYAAFHDALSTLSPTPEPGSRPGLWYLCQTAVASTAAA